MGLLKSGKDRYNSLKTLNLTWKPQIFVIFVRKLTNYHIRGISMRNSSHFSWACSFIILLMTPQQLQPEALCFSRPSVSAHHFGVSGTHFFTAHVDSKRSSLDLAYSHVKCYLLTATSGLKRMHLSNNNKYICIAWCNVDTSRSSAKRRHNPKNSTTESLAQILSLCDVLH